MQFIYFIEPARPEMPESATDEERRIVGEHFAYLKDQLATGTLILAGRTLEPPYLGTAIFEADDLEAADAFAQSDPGIRDGVFKLVRVQPYSVALLRT